MRAPNKLVVFDLDNCLFPTNSMGENFLREVLTPLAESMEPEAIDAVHQALWRAALPDVITTFHIADEVATRMYVAFMNLRVPSHIRPYPDVLPVLRYLHSKHVCLALVTKGYTHLQQGKIDVLGIAPFFEHTYIVGVGNRFSTKLVACTNLLEVLPHRPATLVVVGDGPEEIDAGLSIGATTIQTLRPDVVRNDRAQYHVPTLWGIIQTLSL